VKALSNLPFAVIFVAGSPAKATTNKNNKKAATTSDDDAKQKQS